MNQRAWLVLGIVLAMGAGGPARAESGKRDELGNGPAYVAAGKIPVLHEGRRKPLDTLAREEVRQIFGREQIRLYALRDGKIVEVARWSPVAAILDWSARPEFWDDQPVILVEHMELKRLLLADSILSRCNAIADKPTTSPADRDALRKLATDTAISAATLGAFLKGANIAADDRKALVELAVQLSEEHKWLTPLELENARVTIDGQSMPFDTWFEECDDRNRRANDDPTGKLKLDVVERRAIEVGARLVHYQAIRDRRFPSVEPLMIMPRPSDQKALAYLTATANKIRASNPDGRFDPRQLGPLELDALHSVKTYWSEIPVSERKDPGTDAEFDSKFAPWLRDNSAWVPLRVLLTSKLEDLEAAGYPAEPLKAFVAAFQDFDKAERETPGEVPAAKGTALLAATRALGESLNSVTYPTTLEVARETFFNAFAPFYWAPWAYGVALALLSICLGFSAEGKRGTLYRSLYTVGLVAFTGGIALEVVGFYFRFLISGWGLVTNMYETVIWVALVAAMLGLVFELIYRQVFPVVAAAGVALLATMLAANVPLLDPDIHGIQPVLRNRFWLGTHVLMEVGSYAAFALAMGLGMIAVIYYLTATYRRTATLAELGSPLMPGLPLAIVGSVAVAASYGMLGPQWAVGGMPFFYIAAGMAGLGGFMSIVGAGALAGESVSRMTFQDDASLDTAAVRGQAEPYAATAVQTVTVAESGGAVATLTKPSVAEIRALAAASRPKLDARGRAMQATAADIKPLSNFIYRAMQVGVLMIAAGTILGGVWADYSWGRFWGWDPKEVWALITLLVYLIPLHGRFAGWVNMFGLVMASVVCFLSVIMAWYGVNFVLGVGLHSYGFVEGGSQGIVLLTVVAVLGIPGAAAWRRWLSSRQVVAAA
jgi:ABC-type transport system involved in cytochrome c biogenesis permease subunit